MTEPLPPLEFDEDGHVIVCVMLERLPDGSDILAITDDAGNDIPLLSFDDWNPDGADHPVFTTPDPDLGSDWWSALDRDYFERHPEVPTFIRPFVPGELREVQGNACCVHQVKPGHRTRHVMTLLLLPVAWQRPREEPAS